MDSLNSTTNGLHLPNNQYRNEPQVLYIPLKCIFFRFLAGFSLSNFVTFIQKEYNNCVEKMDQRIQKDWVTAQTL